MADIYEYERRYLEVYWRGLEIRAGIFPYEERFNPYHDEKGRFCSAPSKASAKSLTKKQKRIKIKISGKEARFIRSEINTWYYHRYSGKKKGVYYSGLYNKQYNFDIYGYGDYRFTAVKKLK